jgi:hypothetical protein
VRSKPNLAALLKQKKGLLLDISFGGTKQPRSLTLGPNGDVKHDPRVVPFPLPAGCVHTAVVTHVLEYLPPQQVFAWFDELARVMQPYGIAYLSGPYGGDESQGWLSDPTHQTRIVEQTFAWLDDRLPFYALHESVGRSKPRIWHTVSMARVPGAHGTTSYNCAIQIQPEGKK